MCTVTESISKIVSIQKGSAMNGKGVSAAKKAETLTVRSDEAQPAVPLMMVTSVQVAPCKVSLVTAAVAALEDKIKKEAVAATLDEKSMTTVAANKAKSAVSKQATAAADPEPAVVATAILEETAVDTSSAKKTATATATASATKAVQTFSPNDAVDHHVVICF